MVEYRFKGRILGVLGGLYEILPTDLEEENKKIFCLARGALRHKEETPLVGDFVILRSDMPARELSDAGEGGGKNVFIEEIADRKNALIRPSMANLDYLFITAAAAKPEPSILAIDKLVSAVIDKSVTPVIIINKKDVSPERAEEICDIYRKINIPAFAISAKTGEGTDELKGFVYKALENKTAAFAGASGVGKSSTLNIIFPDLMLKASDISRKTARGKHTTRAVSLFRHGLENGRYCYIADTPGFGLIDFANFAFLDFENLPFSFPEFLPYLGHCRYTKCTHTKEDGCKILEAVSEGIIPPSRHESYIAMYGEMKSKRYR